MSDDNITQVDFGPTVPVVQPGEPALLPRPYLPASKRCRHEAVFVSLEDREVTCRGCNKQVDPFAVLERIAKLELRLTWSQKAASELGKHIGELQAEERRVKARLARARKGLP